MITRVLFVCTQNASRAGMAASLFNQLAAPGLAYASSAGTDPFSPIQAEITAALRELGIEGGELAPAQLDRPLVLSADLVVVLGGGRDRALPTARMIDWIVPDPAGQPLDRVRQIRDELAGRVRALLAWGGWSRTEPVAGPAHRLEDVAGRAELPAQAIDVGIDRAGVQVRRRVPDVLEQLRA
jgi:arsenate reductase